MMIDKDILYLEMAIEESRKCTPTQTSYCVGAVVVAVNGKVYKGFTHETDLLNHAEEEAIAKALADGAKLQGATIYCSMEPCSSRNSKIESCSTLIIRHGFAKVVYAYCEPDHFVKCEGTSQLKAAGINVKVVGLLSPEVRKINSHILL